MPATSDAGNACPLCSARCAHATARARARACAIASRSALAIASSTRQQVESDATGPNTRGLVSQRGDVADGLAAVGDHHRQIGQHPAGIMRGLRRRTVREHRRQLRRQRGLVGQIGEQPRARMRHDTGAISGHLDRQGEYG